MFAAAIEKTELEQRIFSSDQLSAEDKLLNISSWGFIAFFISAFSEEYFATGLHKASEGTGKKIFHCLYKQHRKMHVAMFFLISHSTFSKSQL